MNYYTLTGLNIFIMQILNRNDLIKLRANTPEEHKEATQLYYKLSAIAPNKEELIKLLLCYSDNEAQ